MSNSINSTPENLNSEKTLSSEAQNRVNTVVNAALKIIETTPGLWSALQDTFNKMVDHNMRNPEDIQKLLDWLYSTHRQNTAKLDPSQRLNGEESFTQFIEWFSQNVAYMQRNIGWSDDLNERKNTFDEKKKSITGTYASLINDMKPA